VGMAVVERRPPWRARQVVDAFTGSTILARLKTGGRSRAQACARELDQISRGLGNPVYEGGGA